MKKLSYVFYLVLVIFIFLVGYNIGNKNNIDTILTNYELECYNDSTLGYYWIMGTQKQGRWFKCDSMNYVRGDSLFNTPASKGYYHKNPYYDDFQNWVRKKYCY